MLLSYLLTGDALNDWSGLGWCYASGGFMIYYYGFFGDKIIGFSFIYIVTCGETLGFMLSYNGGQLFCGLYFIIYF
jgi:hypothetical protein